MAAIERGIVKLCGLSDVQAVEVAIESHATAVGFMLAPSKRQVSVATVARIGASVPRDQIEFVAVTVNEPADQLRTLLENEVVDVVQLSGDESPDLLDEVEGRFWKALRFASGTDVDQAVREMDRWLDRAHPAERILVDASIPGAYGGTGHRADWDLVARIAEQFPIVLAGGLDPENVRDAIRTTGVAGVDVSSGIETEGRKDHAKMRKFVDEARRAFELT